MLFIFFPCISRKKPPGHLTVKGRWDRRRASSIFHFKLDSVVHQLQQLAGSSRALWFKNPTSQNLGWPHNRNFLFLLSAVNGKKCLKMGAKPRRDACLPAAIVLVFFANYLITWHQVAKIWHPGNKARKHKENHKWLKHCCTVGNIGNFWLITKSGFYTNFGPQKIDFLNFWRIFKFWCPKKAQKIADFLWVKKWAFCPMCITGWREHAI